MIMNILDRSALKTKNGIPCFEIPQMVSIGWIQHAFLTRKGGTSPPPFHSLNLSEDNGDWNEHVSQNKKRIAAAFSFHPARLILLGQIHQDQILLLKEPSGPLPSFMGYDAVITNSPNTFLGILTADCLPIFIVDQKTKVIAAIHAGRQGTALHIVPKVLEKMREVFESAAQDLLISLGPSIGPCCYEIDEKVFQREWQPFSTLKEKSKWMVDIAQINISQMKGQGIKEEQMFGIDLCTSCHNDIFFSYRKEGRTGRQLSFIGII